MLNSLDDANNGVYELRTASGSTYHFDLDYSTLLRVPGISDSEDWDSSNLRKDNEAVTVVSIERVAVNERAFFMLMGVNEDASVITSRITTPIISITKL